MILIYENFKKDLTMSLKLGRLNPSKTLLLLCDMQQKFSGIITHFNEVAESSSRIAQTANLLNMKTLITEHYPKGLGHTVPALHSLVPDAKVITKTKFSMCTEELMSVTLKQYDFKDHPKAQDNQLKYFVSFSPAL